MATLTPMPQATLTQLARSARGQRSCIPPREPRTRQPAQVVPAWATSLATPHRPPDPPGAGRVCSTRLVRATHTLTAQVHTSVLQESQAALAEGMSGVVPRLRAVANGHSTATPGPTTAPQP
jgi:hypothetical protein